MKTLSEVSSDKLRGGFYTPDPLVTVCLDRVAELTGPREGLRVLEPSMGDGAFLRCLARHPIARCVHSLLGVEVVEAEAQKSREQACIVPFDTTILTTSAVDYTATTDDQFDVVVGNPPFVRFQFVSANDLEAAERLGNRLGLTFRGVSNLWIPILLGALSRLRSGGVMALVVPAEIFTGFSAGDVRTWLLSNFVDLRIDMFAPGSFPDVLQEVVVISGRRANSPDRGIGGTCVQFVEHSSSGREDRWSHTLPFRSQSWTRFLLTPSQLDALAEARSLAAVQDFGAVAKLEVSIVTGANEYFSVTSEELTSFELQPWAVPLLPRIKHARGLIYTPADHEATVADGAKAWLLHFGEQLPDPLARKRASEYLAIGETQGLHTRYKTSIRTPWYRVPSVWAGKLMLSKRSHWFPRLVFNAANVVTTDTIYRGSMLPMYEGRELDLVAAFHNSLTLLTAELEGRSFGGGVLELVPSEIARLTVPLPRDLAGIIPRLDSIARDAALAADKKGQLIEETDTLLSKHVPGLAPSLVQQLREAREFLLRRRLSRN